MPVRKRPISDINVVPYIDVMLVLLVVFMVTAPLITQGIVLQLPAADAPSLPQKEEPLIVSIDQQGQYYFNLVKTPDQPTDLLEIQDQIRKILQQKPNAQVLIEGDGRVPYAKVIFLMSELQKTGVKGVGLITSDLKTTE